MSEYKNALMVYFTNLSEARVDSETMRQCSDYVIGKISVEIIHQNDFDVNVWKWAVQVKDSYEFQLDEFNTKEEAVSFYEDFGLLYIIKGENDANS